MSDMGTGGPGRDPRPETVRETETVRQTVRETGPGISPEPIRDAGAAPGRGMGGTNLILMLLVAVVLGLVIWMVMNRGSGDGGVEVNLPSVEAPDVNVEVKESGK